MQAGNLVASDVIEYKARVLVAGVQREIESWSTDRELSSDLPEQVVGMAGISQATGSISFVGEDVEEFARNPWNRATGWLPSRGDRVEIFVSDGITEWKKFHGLIDKVSGTVSEGFTATLIDDFDRFSARFDHEALLRVMPPLADGDPRRGVGLSTHYYLNYAARLAGYFCTPPNEYDTAISVPGQGSLWPSQGTLTSGTGGGEGSHHASYPAPWGLANANFNVSYSPRVSHPSTTTVQMTVLIDTVSKGNFFFTAYYGSGGGSLQLAVSNRLAIARVNGSTVFTLALGSATKVTLLYKAGVVTMRTNAGGEASGTATITAGSMSSVDISAAADVRVAGFQVSHPNTVSREFISLNHVPNFVPDYRSGALYLLGLMDAGPAIENETSQGIIERISKATLSPVWIDETGVLRTANSPLLRALLPVRTVTTLDDILSLDWESSVLGSRSRVHVKGRKPAINSGLWRTKIAYRGSGSLSSGDIDEQFIGPDDNTDWIMPDETFTILGPSNWSAYNDNLNSVAGVHFSKDGEPYSPAGLSVAIALQKIGLKTYKLTHTAGVFPTGVTAELATHPTDAGLYPRNRDKGLPRINARALVSWADEEYTPTGAGGVGPELTHEAEFWVNRTDSTEILARIGTYLQSQTSAPEPTITGLRIVPDPRLQLGDSITIDSPTYMGASLTALIVGISESFGGSYEQQLTVRIIRSKPTFETYAEFNKSTVPVTYQQWQAAGPVPESYSEFNMAMT